MFTPDASVIVISLFCIVAIVSMIIYVLNVNKLCLAIPTILGILLFVFFFLKAPYGIVVENDTIIVKQFLGSITISNIKTIEHCDKKQISNAIRVFGNGGFFGYVGKYSSPELGDFYMAAINLNKLVKITTKEGLVYVINYPDQ